MTYLLTNTLPRLQFVYGFFVCNFIGLFAGVDCLKELFLTDNKSIEPVMADNAQYENRPTDRKGQRLKRQKELSRPGYCRPRVRQRQFD
jgi:hypothetical protein